MIRPVTKIQDKVPVKTAMMTVSNKKGIDELAHGLFERCTDLTIFSSGGTYKHLREAMDPRYRPGVIEVSEYTGQPETEGGLVKTLNHKLFLGYLTENFNKAHQEDLDREHAVQIDLVVVDLYPFSEAVNAPDATPETARGNIDIGGPSALKAAAKNYLRVMTLAGYSHERYFKLLADITENDGCTTLEMRFNAFVHTQSVLANYQWAIYNYFKNIPLFEIKMQYEIV